MPPATVVELVSAPFGNRTGVGQEVLHSGSGASLSLSELAGSVGAQVQVCPKIVGHRPGAICPPASVGTLILCSPPTLSSDCIGAEETGGLQGVVARHLRPFAL